MAALVALPLAAASLAAQQPYGYSQQYPQAQQYSYPQQQPQYQPQQQPQYQQPQYQQPQNNSDQQYPQQLADNGAAYAPDDLGGPDQQQPLPTPTQQPLAANDLEQLLAPIAIYPDNLVAQILAASTYPAEISAADQWVKQMQAQGYGSPDQIAAGANTQGSWDPSVKALTAFPQVLDMLNHDLQWTTALGNAYYNQPQDVMEAIQVLRQRAQQAGNLETTAQQQVTDDQGYIGIQPVDPEVVYVPTYDPWYVYGAPIVPYPGFGFWGGWGPYYGGPLISFGYGCGLGAFARFGFGWGFWGMNWHEHGVFYNHGYYGSRSNSVRDWGFPHGGPRAFPGRGGYGGHTIQAGRSGWGGNAGYAGNRGNGYWNGYGNRGNGYGNGYGNRGAEPGNRMGNGFEGARGNTFQRPGYANGGNGLSYGRGNGFSHPQMPGGQQTYNGGQQFGGRPAYGGSGQGFAGRPGYSGAYGGGAYRQQPGFQSPAYRAPQNNIHTFSGMGYGSYGGGQSFTRSQPSYGGGRPSGGFSGFSGGSSRPSSGFSGGGFGGSRTPSFGGGGHFSGGGSMPHFSGGGGGGGHFSGGGGGGGHFSGGGGGGGGHFGGGGGGHGHR